MHRPIGVILLAIGAGAAALYQLYLMLVYLSILDFPIGRQAVSRQAACRAKPEPHDCARGDDRRLRRRDR